MKRMLKHWLHPPVFAGDDAATHRASLLHAIILTVLAFLILVIVGNLLGGHIPISTLLIDSVMFMVVFLFHRLLHTGKIGAAGVGFTILGFLYITGVCISLGTIRTPSTATYLFLVIMTGALFGLNGILTTTVASSLAVLGLIFAENAGMLPPPDYTVTITQWITYTTLFGLTGGAAYYTNNLTRQALVQAEKEIRKREHMEDELRKLSRAVEQSPSSIVITDLNGTIEYVNPRFTHVTGYRFDEALGNNPRILKTEQTPPETHRHLWATLTAGKEWHGEFVNRKKDGTLYYEAATISPVTDADGVATHYLAVKEDITERKQVERTLRESEERFRMMFETHEAVMLLVDPISGQILDANYSAGDFYGHTRATLKGMSINDINILTPDEIRQEMQRAKHNEINYFVFPHRLANGAIRTVEVHSSPLILNEKPTLFSIIHDITERKRMEDELRRWAHIFEYAEWGIMIGAVDSQTVELANPAFAKMHGYTVEELTGLPLISLFPPETRAAIPVNIQLAYEKGHHIWESIHLRKDGSQFPVLIDVTAVRDSDGTILYRVVNVQDITERKQAEEALQKANEQLQAQLTEIEQLQAELHDQATHDPLTGLYNRRYLSAMFGREIKRAEREHAPLSVIVSDIDHFKQLNDTYGHQAGDAFLIEVARLLERYMRGSDFICRYGGEEFLLVLPGATTVSALKRAEEIRKKCAELCIDYAGHTLMATMSLGVATYPDHGQAAEAIIIKADKALYRSKHAGRNQVTVWRESQRAVE